MTPQAGPDYILEPSPDGPILSAERLNALSVNDSSTLHQNERVWWVQQKQDDVDFAGLVEAIDESLGRIRVTPNEHWLGTVPANSTSHAIFTGTDLNSTRLEMLNLPALPGQHCDGMSFVPALRAQIYDRGPVYWHFPHYSNHSFQSPGGALRLGRYKLLEYYEIGTMQLFDLDDDISEQNDLAKSQPEIVKKRRMMLHEWRKQVDAKMPYPKTATSTPAPGSSNAKPNW
jgi:hypothetical protein